MRNPQSILTFNDRSAILYIYPEALVGREDVAVVGEPLAEQIKSEAPWTEASAQETSRLETTLNLKGE